MKEKKNKPLVRYDLASDVLYIATRKGVEEEFTEVAPGVNVELDDKGNVLGVEMDEPEFLRRLIRVEGRNVELKRHAALNGLGLDRIDSGRSIGLHDRHPDRQALDRL